MAWGMRGASALGVSAPRGGSVFVAQLPLAGATAIIAFGIALFDPSLLLSQSLVIGFVLVFIVTVLALVVPWKRLPTYATGALPVLDIAAISFMHTPADVIRMTLLLILPTIWLASAYFTTGAVVAFVCGTIAAWGPLLVTGEPFTVSQVSRVLLVPLIVAIVGMTIANMAHRSLAQQAQLAEQGRQLEQALGEAKRDRWVLDAVLNSVDFGIIALREDREPLVNATGLRMLGATNEASWAEIPKPELLNADGATPLPAAEHPVVRARAGEAFSGTLVWLKRDRDAPVALSVSAMQLRDERAWSMGAVVVFADVTASVQALRLRDDVASAVSHELRTPLTSVIGYLDLVVDDVTLTDGSRKNVRVAAQNAERMLRILDDLLVAASDRAGAFAVRKHTVDLTSIVRESVEAAMPLAQNEGITVTCRLDGERPAFVDQLRLRQVLDNVLSNAIKYGRSGGEVEIALDTEPGQLVLRVRDDGIGIADEEQQALFSHFFRATSARDTATIGIGLGLSVSRAIMREHGGDLRVQSELGIGTTVEVIIPTTAVAETSSSTM